MQWLDGARGWRAEPDDVVKALAADGFQECKRETARNPPRSRHRRRLARASTRPAPRLHHLDARARRRSLVFITINGHPLQGLRVRQTGARGPSGAELRSGS